MQDEGGIHHGYPRTASIAREREALRQQETWEQSQRQEAEPEREEKRDHKS